MSSSRYEQLDTAEFDAFVEGLDHPMFVVTANHTYAVARDARLLVVHVN